MLEHTPTSAEGVDPTPEFTRRIVETRHGLFTIYDEDELVVDVARHLWRVQRGRGRRF